MTSTDIAMLVGGIAVLLAAIGLLIYCVLKNKPYKPSLVLFFVAIAFRNKGSANPYKFAEPPDADAVETGSQMILANP